MCLPPEAYETVQLLSFFALLSFCLWLIFRNY